MAEGLADRDCQAQCGKRSHGSYSLSKDVYGYGCVGKAVGKTYVRVGISHRQEPPSEGGMSCCQPLACGVRPPFSNFVAAVRQSSCIPRQHIETRGRQCVCSRRSGTNERRMRSDAWNNAAVGANRLRRVVEVVAALGVPIHQAGIESGYLRYLFAATDFIGTHRHPNYREPMAQPVRHRTRPR